MRTIFSVLTLVLVLALPAHAQIDASAAWLIRRPTAAPSEFDARPTSKTPRAKIVITPTPAVAEPEIPARPVPVLPHAIDLGAREPASEEDELHEESLSLRFSAGYAALDADSSFAPRDYAGGGALVGLGVTLWATPVFGLRADYLSTLSASVREAGTRYGLDHQELDAAAIYRYPLGRSSWDFGVGYHQLSNAIARGQLGPYGSVSRGLDLSAGLDLRGHSEYVHRVELHLHPLLAHDELGVKDGKGSGSSNTSYGASVVVGGRDSFSREREYFWRLKYTFEQNAFSGGRTVTSGQAHLTLGISWGS